MRALLAQLHPRPGEVAVNLATAAGVVESHPDAQIAVFPELYVSGYRTQGLEAVAIADPREGLSPVAEAAGGAGTACLIGFVEAAGGRWFNSLACIDERGAVAAVYRKTHLFGAERGGFAAGASLAIVELAGRRVAPLICFDIEFPEPARALADAGADLLVTAAANMDPGYRDQQLASRARALENRIPHLYVNRCGTEAGLEFCGGTRSVDSDGEVEVEAARRDEQVVVAEVGPSGAADERLEYLAQRRGSLPVEVAAPVGGAG